MKKKGKKGKKIIVQIQAKEEKLKKMRMCQWMITQLERIMNIQRILRLGQSCAALMQKERQAQVMGRAVEKDWELMHVAEVWG